MNKNQQKFMIGVVLFIFMAFCCSQEEEEKNRYSKTPNSLRRYSTTSQEKNAGSFLPVYNDIAQDRDKGITLEDWSKYLLSEDRFIAMDSNGDELISREELAVDPLQGEAQLIEQGEDVIKQACKKEVPDYTNKLQNFKKIGYRNIGKSAEYVIDKNAPASDVETCQYSGCSEIATKLFIQARHGKDLSGKVCAGHHALLFIKEQQKQSSLNPYIFALIVLGLTVAVSLMTPVLVGEAKA
jgi:hypothetical protein